MCDGGRGQDNKDRRLSRNKRIFKYFEQDSPEKKFWCIQSVMTMIGMANEDYSIEMSKENLLNEYSKSTKNFVLILKTKKNSFLK